MKTMKIIKFMKNMKWLKPLICETCEECEKYEENPIKPWEGCILPLNYVRIQLLYIKNLLCNIIHFILSDS
jgi:hypothetical protein